MPTHEAYVEVAQITLEKFVRIIKEGKPIPSVEVVVDGNYRFTAIVPSKEGGVSIYDDIKTNAIALAVRSNIPLHPSVYDVLSEAVKPTMPLSAADRMAKARAARKPRVAVAV